MERRAVGETGLMARQQWWLRVLIVLVCLVTLGGPGAGASVAGGEWEWRDLGGTTPILYAEEQEVGTYVAPPRELYELRAQAATITVQYEGFPPEAQASFQHAVNIWSSLLNAPVTIRIQAQWKTLGQGILGGAGPTGLYRNSSTNTWYPPALAKQLAGRDLSPNQPDIFAQFSNNNIPWYFGTGETPAGQYNFATVVLHELGHGLGIFDSFGVDNSVAGYGEDGFPVAFDRFVVDEGGRSLVDTGRYPNPSAELAAAVQSGQLYFSGSAAGAANGDPRPRLFAPNPFQPGSSVAHLDDEVYPPGTPNSLMTSRLSRGETNYNPGPIAMGMLADIGWSVAGAPPPSPSPSATPSPSANPSPPPGTGRCFPETGQCISGRFQAYWEAHGGLAINGYPLTGERVETLEDGKQYTVQWFERVRMEYHPENADPQYQVLLGQFGRRIHPADPPVAAQPGLNFFPQTGHNMSPDFFAYWNANGGLPQFGFPLSEEFVETLEDGKQYVVQYTERARFERHPENPQPYTILLGQFGRRILAGGGASPSPSPSPSGSPAPQGGAQIAITPRQGPNETLFILTGTGFAPNTTYFLRIASQDGQRQIPFDDPSTESDEDGIVLAGFDFGSAVPAGGYTASVATARDGGTTVASTNFNLSGPGGAAAGPALSVTPSQAKGGALLVLTGTGFAPNTTYTLRVQSEDRKLTIPFNNSDVRSDADGIILSGFSLSTARPAGVYIAEVVSKGGTPAVLAGTTFTLTPANLRASALPGGELAGVLVPLDGLVWHVAR